MCTAGLPGGSVVKKTKKNYSCNTGDAVSVPVSERSPGEGNGNPLQQSCLENSKDRRAWQATVHGVAKESDMTKQLNNMKIYAFTMVTHIVNFLMCC